jgi:AAA domain
MDIEPAQKKMDQAIANGAQGVKGTNVERRPIVLRSAAELASTATAPQWLIEPYIEKDSSILLFGDLGTLKSFLALHWSLEAALRGHQVVYLCAEGKGLGRRLKGWARHRWGEKWQREIGKLPFFGIERPLNLSALSTMAELTAVLKAGAIEPALIVVDTISKNSDGRVEASTEDANSYLNLIDQLLRSIYKATVILVHHTGHQEKNRARGPYALMASTDANFRVERPDLDKLVITVTAGRMKDTESPPAFSLQAKVVETGDLDSKGVAVTTLILESTSLIAAAPARGRGRNQDKFAVALKEWMRAHPGAEHISSMEMFAICKAQKIDRRRRSEVLDTFVNSRILTPATGGYALHAENL